MDPAVVAAWIAAGVSALTLVGTLVAQYLGYRAASRMRRRRLRTSVGNWTGRSPSKTSNWTGRSRSSVSTWAWHSRSKTRS